MPGIPSRMNQNNREQVVSSDLNRIGNLAGRELMDAAQGRSVRADFYNPATNTFDDLSAAAKTTNAVPLSGVTEPPSLDGIAHVFDMALGAGEGTLPATPSSVDVSGNQLLRWPAQTVSWPTGGNPDATNPRICIIVATPADVPADLLSRNILLNPDTRETTPENVYKTSNPLATISVVAGVAAAAPVAPAAPAGTLVLFQVYVPALATDSTAFLPVRQAWRSIEFPGTSQHGILKGCVPQFDPAINVFPGGVHRLVIDGELLTFTSGSGIKADTVTPPTAAPTNTDKPYYLYLCGGRNQPVANFIPIVNTVAPVQMVISATPPDVLGYPTTGLAIATPAISFPIAACCYCGLAFYQKNSTTFVPAFYDGDWIYSQHTVIGGTAFQSVKGFEEVANGNPFPVSYTALALASLPATSTAVDLVAILQGDPNTGVTLADGTADANMITDLFIPSTAFTEVIRDRMKIGRYSASHLNWMGYSASTGSFRLLPVGYNMNIPRIAR